MNRSKHHIVELLLPLHDNDGVAFPPDYYEAVRDHLTEKFGGVTAFMRSPADGVWKQSGRDTHDEIVIFEVVAPVLDRTWWADYVRGLEAKFRQNSIMARSHSVELL